MIRGRCDLNKHSLATGAFIGAIAFFSSVLGLYLSWWGVLLSLLIVVLLVGWAA